MRRKGSVSSNVDKVCGEADKELVRQIIPNLECPLRLGRSTKPTLKYGKASYMHSAPGKVVLTVQSMLVNLAGGGTTKMPHQHFQESFNECFHAEIKAAPQ